MSTQHVYIGKETFSNSNPTIKEVTGTMNNQETTEQLYNTYVDKLITYASDITKDEEAAQDIVQSVFVSLLTSGRTFNNQKHGKDYLYKTVRNQCINWLRHQKVREKHERHMVSSEQEVDHIDEINKVEQDWLVETRKLKIAIDELPPILQTMLKERYIEQQPRQKIAEKHNVTTSIVDHNIRKAINLLREALKDDNRWNGLPSLLLFLTTMIFFIKLIFA